MVVEGMVVKVEMVTTMEALLREALHTEMLICHVSLEVEVVMTAWHLQLLVEVS